MAGVPFVFVSHSSQDRQLTEEVVRLLGPPEGAQGGGYKVLVDYEELKPNVEWPRRLIELMARCHAGVILLTSAAVESDWVLKEATILAARRAVEDERFKLFVVMFPGTKGPGGTSFWTAVPELHAAGDRH